MAAPRERRLRADWLGKALNADADVDPADRDLRADRDTLNVSGMPPLPELRLEDLSTPMQPLLRDQFNILWQASGWADGSPSFG